jgi:hypothetical protein
MSDMSAQVRRALDVAVQAIGGSPREGQIEMAEAVANALTDRHHLMVQAGTGTGKSLAYLISCNCNPCLTTPISRSRSTGSCPSAGKRVRPRNFLRNL